MNSILIEYLKLMRIPHYIKNFLVFIPLFFDRNILDIKRVSQAGVGFLCFSLVASCVYIFNDIRDAEKDRNHPQKCNRPIASGKIGIRRSYFLMILCFMTASILSVLFLIPISLVLLLLYLMLNAAYSLGLKNFPIIDIVILASGFVLRVIYGGIITDVYISKWLYLVIITGSLFMSLGKRRNEFRQQNDTREVLKYYSESFLDKNMYVSAALVIVFYALWSTEAVNPVMIWTVPAFIIILMKYSYDIEGGIDGDPVEVLIQDNILKILILLFVMAVFIMLYLV